MSRLLLLTRNTVVRRRTYATTSSDPFRRPLPFENRNDADSTKPATNHLRRPVDLPSLLPTRPARLHGFRIELVDDALWPHSLCGRSDAAQPQAAADRAPGHNSVPDSPPDMDEIEDLRVRKQLFYKLDGDSKEFDEYNIDFHHHRRKKNSSRRKGQENKECKKPEKPPIRSREIAERKGADPAAAAAAEKRARTRTPTFNQLTGPYHLPFCLDIHVTKGSVRACVVHRVTSRVVAVAHSISKDLRFDVGSRKDARACAAVGAVLAQRAVEDDIHNVVYTPRKGDKIEGKLEVVLRAIIENGVDVKVKLKQRRPVKRTIV